MPLPGVPDVPASGLIGGRIRLRRITAGDVVVLQQLSGDAEVVRWTSYPADLDETRALTRITRGQLAADRVVFCVAELDGRPAGTCGAGVGEADGGIEIFYAVLPWARRQGVASTAAALLVSAARAAGAGSVTLVTHLDNTASHAVARNTGFVLVGQERRPVKDVPTDVLLWQWTGEPA